MRLPLATDDGGVATPRPCGSLSASARANRVQCEVADQLEDMGIGLDQHRVVSPLEAMSGLAVASIEMLRIAGIQPLHASSEIWIESPHEQVVVRRHEHEAVACPFVSCNDFIEEFQELTSISVVAEDRLTSYAASHDVVRGAGQLETRRTCHAPKVVPPWRRAIARAALVTMS